MLTVSEWGDNIMIGESKDYINFVIRRKPLINCHCSNHNYLYKPTGVFIDNNLLLFYTACNVDDNKRNDLLFTKKHIVFSS